MAPCGPDESERSGGLRPLRVDQPVEVRSKDICKLDDSLRRLWQEVEDRLTLAERSECYDVEPVLIRHSGGYVATRKPGAPIIVCRENLRRVVLHMVLHRPKEAWDTSDATVSMCRKLELDDLSRAVGPPGA